MAMLSRKIFQIRRVCIARVRKRVEGRFRSDEMNRGNIFEWKAFYERSSSTERF